MALTSASGFVAMLNEEHDDLKSFALEQLNRIVDEFWAEIAESLAKIEELSEDENFKRRDLAALVASKVHYHLEQYSDAMNFALGAGSLFDVGAGTEYSNTLVSKCIDEYIRLRVEQAESKTTPAAPIDQRLENIVENMFTRCFQNREYKQALGIALESRRLDKVEATLAASGYTAELLQYCFKVSLNLVPSRDFRKTVLQSLVRIYRSMERPDYINVCQILIFLDEPQAVAQLLDQLIKASLEETLVAYQIAFDLCTNATQQFLANVRQHLPSLASAGDAAAMETGDSYEERHRKLADILTGEPLIRLHLEFLCRNNHTDLLILKNIKAAVDRNSVTHNATVFANALMHAGTTVDTFLRDNLDWLARATNWAKFSATAGLGVIHKGHLKESLTLLSPYLPQQGVSASAYSEGGGLYALGLIHANRGEAVTAYLLNALRSANTNEIVQHGACLGLGLAAMASGREDVYDELRNVLYMDSAVAGEAAGLAMGLVMLGSASEKAVSEMLPYAHDTKHEKIIRGLALGLALVFYGREEEADTLIEQLALNKDPILRYGGMYAIALAYAGTANNHAIRKLLHVAVSDTSDDVRRAAVTGLGFVLFRQPKQCPKLVALLAKSYNPHVRYGATLAVGISCAGSGLKDALDLLEPLAADSVDFVRQGALIALAMVLMQVSAAREPKAEAVRKLFADKIADKHEDTMAKFGAILASGLIDAGGRNVTISLGSRSGHNNMSAIVGLAVFTQFWYWFPLVHFVSLSFTPTALIGLNKDLQMPDIKFRSNARPSLFAYPPEVKPPTTQAPTKLETVELSITKKAKARAKSKEEEAAAQKMEVDAKPNVVALPTQKEEEKPAAPAEKEEKQPEEPSFELLQNPARVIPQQVKYISLEEGSRYVPVKAGELFGVTMLRDLKPDEPEALVVLGKATGGTSGATGGAAAIDEDEPAPPEPFEYNG